MPLVVVLTGSPSAKSRTLSLSQHVGQRIAARGLEVKLISVRDLDPVDLIHARTDSAELREAFALIARADALVVATPVYKAAYSGVLKTFLDLLPQLGLTGKTVLPLATGGTLAHVLAIDYALRPVLASLGASHVLNGLFILDKTLAVEDAGLRIDADVSARLDALVEELLVAVLGRQTPHREQRSLHAHAAS